MKKVIALIMAFSVIMGLCGCNTNHTDSNSQIQSSNDSDKTQISETEKEDIKEEPQLNNLEGKSILFVGDSITAAENDGRIGWAGRVGEANKMKWKNGAISGACISNARRDNRVLSQLLDNRNEEFDYVILHGMMNDAMENAPLGSVTPATVMSDFKGDTYVGALEQLISTAKTLFPNAKIGFIINYATPNSTWGGKTANFSEYVELTKIACEKWQIPYLDLYFGSVSENGKELSYSYDILMVNSMRNLLGKERSEIHISTSGYEVISPYISNWLKTI